MRQRSYSDIGASVILYLLTLLAFILCIFAFTPAYARVLCIKTLDFAPVPEHVVVEGLPETIQMGIWQIDPDNKWPAGDQTRSTGWQSHLVTQLVDVATGQTPQGFTYDGLTGELKYTGGSKRDFTVQIRQAGVAASNQFRLRVLRPTVAYGTGAAAVNTAKGWGARVCEYPAVPFATCRTSGNFVGGASDAAPLVLYIPPGTYGGQDWFLGSRTYLYVLGAPGMTTTLVGDNMAPTKVVMLTLRNLNLNNTNIGTGGDPVFNVTINLSNINQWGETAAAQNGVVNANGSTKAPWLVNVWNFISTGMGNSGNAQHAFYIEGRALGRFEVNNSQCRGSKGSSCYKTDMHYMAVRHSLICTTADCTSVGAGTVAKGMTTHTMIDVPAAGTVIVYGNRFKVWKDHSKASNFPGGYTGAFTAAVFIRQRQAFRGSDIPLYPDISYDPPIANIGIRGAPGPGWDGSAATFVNPAFWNDVAAKPDDFAFKHYISFNVLEELPNTVGDVPLLRDDGTSAIEAVVQFGPGRALRAPQNWRERSKTYLYANEYVGYTTPPPYQLNRAQQIVEVEPGAVWPRTKPEHFPTAVDVTGELPAWFLL